MKILSRVLVLMILCIGIGYVLFSPTVKTAAVRECCENCPGGRMPYQPPDPEYAEASCDNSCDPEDETCYQNCAASINRCYQYCTVCSGGDAPPEPQGVYCTVKYVKAKGYQAVCN